MNTDDFDEHFKSTSKLVGRIFRFGFVSWIIGGLISIAIWGLVIWGLYEGIMWLRASGGSS